MERDEHNVPGGDVVHDLEQVSHMFDFERVEGTLHDGFITMSAELGPLDGERDAVRGDIGMRVGPNASFAAGPDTSKTVESVRVRGANAQDQVLVHEVLP
jgi:hypothetical protein